MLLYKLAHFQVHGSTGRHNECSTVRIISVHIIVNVLFFLLGCHGKVISFQASYISRKYAYSLFLRIQYLGIYHTEYFNCLVAF
jgi:hypothetical protein